MKAEDMKTNEDRILDLALGQTLGSRQAPDVSARVLAALDAPASREQLRLVEKPKQASSTLSHSRRPVHSHSALRKRLTAAALAASVVVGLGMIVYPWDVDVPAIHSVGPGTYAAAPARLVAIPDTLRPLSGAQLQAETAGIRLMQGSVMLESATPPLFVGSGRVDGVEGRAIVRVGGRPAKAELDRLISQLTSNNPLPRMEEKMIRNMKNWKVSGTMAVCCISGSMLVNGEFVRAENVEVAKSGVCGEGTVGGIGVVDVFGVFPWLDRNGDGVLDATDVGPEFVRLADTDKNGSVSMDEFQDEGFKSLGDGAKLMSLVGAALAGMDQERLPTIVRKSLDIDENGEVNLAEALAAMSDPDAIYKRLASDELFGAVDTNGDGSWSESEFGLGSITFMLGDGDKNGAISKDEWGVLIEKSKTGKIEIVSSCEEAVTEEHINSEGVAAYFEMVDKNNDGFADKAEIDSALAMLGGAIGITSDTVLQAADADKDGKLNKDEFVVAAMSFVQVGDATESSVESSEVTLGDFASLDANKDGFITADEFSNLPGGAGATIIKMLDHDGDGKLSKVEFGE